MLRQAQRIGETAHRIAAIATQQSQVDALRTQVGQGGAGIFALFIYHAARSSQNIRRIAMLAYAAFAIVLVGELIGRFLFYASYARLGPP